MATEDDDYDGDPLSGGGFTQLLESEDVGPPFLEGGPLCSSSPSHGSHAKLLCFGYDSQNEEEMSFFEGVQLVAQKKGISTGNSCSTSSSGGLSKSRKKAGNAQGRKMQEKRGVVSGSSDVCTTAESCRKAVKREKTKPTCSSTHHFHRPLKAKKEKLGERISALQKLVSPFGKTDTASVLHEAMGYIRFLHDQVQVLSSPYLQRLPSSSAKLQQEEEEEGGESESRYDLKSRGLCLVPVECTAHVARSNGADLWSPAMGTNLSSNR